MIEEVWEMKVYFAAPSVSLNKIIRAELNQIKVGEGFFKTTPYTISKGGIGFMKRTKKEALATIVKQLKKFDTFPDSVNLLKQMILKEYPELLI